MLDMKFSTIQINILYNNLSTDSLIDFMSSITIDFYLIKSDMEYGK